MTFIRKILQIFILLNIIYDSFTLKFNLNTCNF